MGKPIKEQFWPNGAGGSGHFKAVCNQQVGLCQLETIKKWEFWLPRRSGRLWSSEGCPERTLYVAGLTDSLCRHRTFIFQYICWNEAFQHRLTDLKAIGLSVSWLASKRNAWRNGFSPTVSRGPSRERTVLVWKEQFLTPGRLAPAVLHYWFFVRHKRK